MTGVPPPSCPDRSLPQFKGGDIVASFSPLWKGEIPGIELVCWSGSRLECVSGTCLLLPAGAMNRRGSQSLCPVFIRLWRSKQTTVSSACYLHLIPVSHFHACGIRCLNFLSYIMDRITSSAQSAWSKEAAAFRFYFVSSVFAVLLLYLIIASCEGHIKTFMDWLADFMRPVQI